MCIRIVGFPAFVLAVLVFSGCSSTSTVVLDQSARDVVRAQLLAADAAWAEAAGTDDVERVVAFMTDDAVIARRADRPQIVGIDAIREFITWNRESRPGFTISWDATDAWVSADGQTGCTIGVGTITFPNEQTGELMRMQDQYCYVWRNEDGEWKCVLDIGVPGSAKP